MLARELGVWLMLAFALGAVAAAAPALVLLVHEEATRGVVTTGGAGDTPSPSPPVRRLRR